MKFPETYWLTEDYLTCLYGMLARIGGSDQQKELSQLLAASGTDLAGLQIEYTRLFINGYPHALAPPYASVYLDQSLQGGSTERILSFYMAQGLVMRDDADLPDHLVHQLEFLAFLVEKGDGIAERQFLSGHFRPWFEVFARRVASESRHPFYRIMVQIIDYFTKEEDEHGIQDIEA